jgi:signal peptidase I
VAVPGDRVSVHDGALRINGSDVPLTWRRGEPIEVLGAHPHAISLSDGGGPDFDGIVPPDRYLLLGDNRGNSRDGRFFGFVARDRILGRARGVFVRNGAPTWHAL